MHRRNIIQNKIESIILVFLILWTLSIGKEFIAFLLTIGLIVSLTISIFLSRKEKKEMLENEEKLKHHKDLLEFDQEKVEFSKEELEISKVLESWAYKTFIFKKDIVYLGEPPEGFPIHINKKYLEAEQFKGQVNDLQYLILLMIQTGRKLERDSLLEAVKDF